ncbi:sugar ABC transporter substrate-binding protein [Lacticaseibacillus jixiensis]|uniref:sugar ABC transporter substrate-binding protein n=1 Tax=Lacticaseibacillus jixiensis TaxID=3231926 RepID=UPI0036F1EA3F
MKIRNYVALGMGLAMAALLGGCGSKNANDSSNNNSFTVLNVRFPGSSKTYRAKGTVPAASKATNVTVKWKTYTTLEWGDKKGTVLGGGELPDAFFGNTALGDADIANNLASLIPLEKYINKKTMPNLTKIMKKDPKMRAIVTSADGHIYSLPSRMTGRTITGNQLYINKKWLDKLGLKMPTTYQEFEDVMVAMATKDPNGNGKKDEVGLDGFTNIAMIPWGVQASSSTTTQWMNYDGKKVYYTPATETFKKAVEHMHDLYKRGGIDPEFFTQDFTKLMTKFTNASKVGGAVTYNPVNLGKTPDEYVAAPALVGVDGKKVALRDQDPYSRNQFEVTTACKNPKKLLQWVDQFYTPDNSIQSYYGPFGKTTKKNSDGTYSLLKDKSKKHWVQDDFAINNAFRDWAPQYGDDALANKIHYIDNQGDGLRRKIATPLDKYTGPQYPALSFKPEEQKELSSLLADIDAYAGNKYAQWVTKGGVDKEWNAYIKQLNTMGLKKFLSIQQKALKRYDKTMNQ